MILSPYIDFEADEWAKLRADTPLTLNETELRELQGVNEEVSIAQVEGIYLPLSRLLNLYVRENQDLYRATATFLGKGSSKVPYVKVPYVIGMAGSVAVGKSTTARILRELLSRWPNHPKVALVTTDGFLLPNTELKRRGLMERKGFPESYDRRALLEFVSDLKAGKQTVASPVYSHLTYDIVADRQNVVDGPDIIIVEGLNVLQTGREQQDQLFVSDFFDFTIYVDADVDDVQRWYVERFLTLRNTAFRRPESYFHRYASLSDDETTQLALSIWRDINEVNLRENIAPTRERARLILEKGPDHAVRRVRLRKI